MWRESKNFSITLLVFLLFPLTCIAQNAGPALAMISDVEGSVYLTKAGSDDSHKVVFGMLTIKGIYGREMFETWYLMQSMLQTGLDISPVITHRFHYTDFQEAFAVMRAGQSGKVIMDWA